MAALLPPAEFQAIDADGHPYAAGTLATYIPATTTPKATWSEPTGVALNTNPIVLDSAGRAIIYGDGLYRTILKDADGNLVWDQPSSTLVSLAMAPVILAPTLADARDAMGVTAAIAVETARAVAAEAAEAAARAAADAAEAATRLANDTTLLNALNAETARAEAAEAALQAAINAIPTVTAASSFYVGTGASDSRGIFQVGWAPAFATACITFQVYAVDATAWPSPFGVVSAPLLGCNTATSDFNAFNGFFAPPGLSGTFGQLFNDIGALPSTSFYWLAIGY